MTARNYSNTAVQTTLTSGINSVVTSATVAATTGFPSAPFILALDADGASQEIVLVTAVAGTTLTITRGYDGTSAVSHDAGAIVRHSHAAIEFAEANTHVNATGAVHGLTGSIVGTSDTQTLTNKTVALGSNTVSGTLAQLNTVVTDADIASLAGAETLTNKTLALGSNTVSGTTAQFNTALTDNDFATRAGTESLTNKTLDSTSPTAFNPVGSLVMFAGAAAPTGWLLCDGTAVSRATYADLFAVVDTAFGVGDGSTTFNLPDLRDRFPMGKSATKALGSTGGSDTKTLAKANLPTHVHTINHDHETQHNTSDGTSTNVIRAASSSGFSTAETNMVVAHSGNSGNGAADGLAGSAFDVLNPYQALNYIIKV